MTNSCMKGSGLVWLILIIIVIVIIIILIFWAWPWGSCTTCNKEESDDIFRVTVAKKNKSHPNFNKGSDWGFVVNDVQGKTLVLKVGKQYRFIVNCEDHPFYISVNEKGGSTTETTSSSDCSYIKKGGLIGQLDISGTPITSGSFNVNIYKDMPRLLYYTGQNGEYMGGSIIIED